MFLTRALLLIVFLVSLGLSLSSQNKPVLRVAGAFNGANKKFESRFFLVMTLLNIMLVIASVYKPSSMPDYANYVDSYELGFEDRLEPTFYLLSSFLHFFKLPVLSLFFVYSVISLSIKYYTFRDLATLPYTSFSIFLGEIFIMQNLIQIRAAVASAILIMVIKAHSDGYRCRSLILIAIASLFHYSSLLFILILFIKKDAFSRYIYILAIIASYIVAIAGISLSGKLIGFYTNEDYFAHYLFLDDKNSIFSILLVGRVILCIYILYKTKEMTLDRFTNILLQIYAIGICISVAFADLPISARFGQMFMSVETFLFPIICSRLWGRNRTVLCLGLYSLILFVYYFNRGGYWGF